MWNILWNIVKRVEHWKKGKNTKVFLILIELENLI